MANQDQQPRTQLCGRNDAQRLARGASSACASSEGARWHAANLGLVDVGREITDNIDRAGPIEPPMLADPVSNAIAPKLAPLGRFVQSEEVANLVAFLHGPSGCSIAGQRLVICGGASL